MATVNLHFSGRSPSLNNLIKHGYVMKIVLTTPEVEDADLAPSLVITDPQGVSETIALPPITQAALATLLNQGV